MTNRVNYIVACWGGRPEAITYIRSHIELLNKLENEVAQVTLVSPLYRDILPANTTFEKALDELDGTKLDNGAPIVVLRRDNNRNMSYGSFSAAYGEYHQKFDYYIFMEDDYIPARPNFDTILVDLLKQKQCHYLCALVSGTTCGSEGIIHAGVTVGICESAAMEKIWQKYGSLLSDDFRDWHWFNQMNFSYPYHRCGFKIDHFAHTYGVPFWCAHKKSIIHMVPGAELLLIPHQHKEAIK